MRSFAGLPPTPPITLPHLCPANIGPDIGVIEPSCSDEDSHFTWRGESWIRGCAIAKKSRAKRERTSIAWYYGEEVVRETDPKQQRIWYCYLCEQASAEMKKDFKAGEGNDGILKHLENKHNINRVTGVKNHNSRSSTVTPSESEASSIRGAFGHQKVIYKEQLEKFKDLLIRWIVYCHIAYFQFENVYFRALLFYIAPGLEKLLPKTAKVIRGWVLEAFAVRKKQLKEEMRNAHSRIHISFDLWTSTNHKAIVGVVAHYITSKGVRRHVVIGLREVLGDHAGENTGHQLLLLFKEYNIIDRIGFFISDNDSKNDTCIAYLLAKLNPRMSKRMIQRRRIRCLGHIVNLCAQSFIIGKDAEKVCKELEKAIAEGDLKKIGALWKKRGSIGRLHNIIRYIRGSPQRRNRFATIVIAGELAIYNGLQVSVRKKVALRLENFASEVVFPLRNTCFSQPEHSIISYLYLIRTDLPSFLHLLIYNNF